MSACNRCGTVLVPGSAFCHTCGLPLSPSTARIVPMIAPAGTQKALIGSTPMWQAMGGFFFIIIGLVFISINSFFAPFALITILVGGVLLVLGLMGKPIMTEQVVFQTSQTASYSPSGPMKQCRVCGSEIVASALICYKCGASQ